jgi:hypothetical protein
MINPKHIIIRRSNEHEPTLWLSQTLLIQLLGVDENCFSTYLRVKARPQFLKDVLPCHRNKEFLPVSQNNRAYRWGKANGEFYYEYDSIPNKAPTFYADKLPSRNELVELKKASQNLALATPLESYFKAYVNDHYKKYFTHYGYYTKEQQIKLSKAAAFVDCAKIYFQENNLHSSRDNGIYKELTKLLEDTGATYLPKYYRNLKQVLCEAINGKPTVELVTLKRAGNTNAVQHSHDEEVASWIINMRYEGKNFTNSHIIRKVQWLCSISDKKVPSDRWIGEQMETANNKFLTAAGRYGAKGKFGQEYRGYTPFANALFAGDCWQVDGSRMNLVNFKQKVTIIDEATGKERKLDKETFLTCVAVRDVHSGQVLGHCFNLAENRWTYIQAIKMAVETAQYLPYEIVFDRFPGHNTEDFKNFVVDLENRGVKVTITHLAEGKAKMERWFGTLQTVFMQDSNYYYGEGIQSKNAYAHRSKEYLKELRKEANKEGWNWDTACDEASNIIEAYNTTKYSYYSRKFKHIDFTPVQVHEQSEKPNVKDFSKADFAYLFGIKRKEKIANKGLVKFQVSNIMFNYRCANYDVISKYQYVTVCYMLEDMSSIELYEISNTPLKKHLGSAQEIKDIVPYGPNAFDGYGKDKAIIRQIEDFRNQELEYKMAVGFDSMTILEQGGVKKYAYEEADAQATIQLITGGNDDISANDYLRDQY